MLFVIPKMGIRCHWSRFLRRLSCCSSFYAPLQHPQYLHAHSFHITLWLHEAHNVHRFAVINIIGSLDTKNPAFVLVTALSWSKCWHIQLQLLGEEPDMNTNSYKLSEVYMFNLPKKSARSRIWNNLPLIQLRLWSIAEKTPSQEPTCLTPYLHVT